MVKRSFVVIGILAALTALSFTPVLAAESSTSLGYVDVATVFDQYTKTAQVKADLEAYGKQLEQKLQIMAANQMLDDNDLSTLITLATKPNPTDKDKEQIKALQDKEKSLDAELKALQSKSEPTDQEKARQKELMDRVAQSNENLKKMGQSADTEFNAKKESVLTEIRNDILKAVEDVAKKKNISVVIDKIAVFYGGVDLTQPVLDKLNGKK